jgi:hypothetical protein
MPPVGQCLYHITHVSNLERILAAGGLFSDAAMGQVGGPKTTIGMGQIKQRRLTQIPVPQHPGTFVGHYVPFYFCPRSVMLYLIYMANAPELTYRGGQDEILHLEIQLDRILEWVSTTNTCWAFSRSNAGSYYVDIRGRVDELDQLNWGAIAATDWKHPAIREAKQAEFLVHHHVPFDLVCRIGVKSTAVADAVAATLGSRQTPVQVRREWYY